MAILGALRSGVINVLIVDEGNARAVLAARRGQPDEPALVGPSSTSRRCLMPVVPTQEIVGHAFRERYGVAAINVVNDLTMEAVLAAAEDAAGTR